MNQYTMFATNSSESKMVAWFEEGDYTLIATCRGSIQDDIDQGVVDNSTLKLIHKLDQQISMSFSSKQLKKLVEEFPEFNIKGWWGNKSKMLL